MKKQTILIQDKWKEEFNATKSKNKNKKTPFAPIVMQYGEYYHLSDMQTQRCYETYSSMRLLHSLHAPKSFEGIYNNNSFFQFRCLFAQEKK